MDRERRDQDMTMRGSSVQNEGQQMRESYYLAFRMFGEGEAYGRLYSEG
jgi:hypothetical protein